MKTALIVVDAQQFFLHDAPDNLPRKIAAEVARGGYDAVAFTVFQNTPESNFNRSLNWPKCNTTEDVQLPDEFRSYVTDQNVFTRDKYSGFSGTKLHAYLQSRGIEKVVLCGIDADACVLATAFSAFDLGYMIEVKFELTFSGNDLKSQARDIMQNNLVVQDKQAE